MRDTVCARLRAVDPAGIIAAGEQVVGRVGGLPEFAHASRVGLYAATKTELPTRPLFERMLSRGSARCALPRVIPGTQLEFAFVSSWENLRPGRYGLFEPGPECEVVALQALDLLFVPGLAFDVHGGRLGRGGGYYDRALAAIPPGAARPAVFGMAHDWQVVNEVPKSQLDQRVEGIVTERRVLRVEGKPGSSAGEAR